MTKQELINILDFNSTFLSKGLSYDSSLSLNNQKYFDISFYVNINSIDNKEIIFIRDLMIRRILNFISYDSDNSLEIINCQDQNNYDIDVMLESILLSNIYKFKHKCSSESRVLFYNKILFNFDVIDCQKQFYDDIKRCHYSLRISLDFNLINNYKRIILILNKDKKYSPYMRELKLSKIK